jgi:hypothetical protein
LVDPDSNNSCAEDSQESLDSSEIPTTDATPNSTERKEDLDSDIIIINHKDTLKAFIEKSPLGLQFAILALYYLARSYYIDRNKGSQAVQLDPRVPMTPYSFTSKEFFDTYRQLAFEMGLTKYLVRHMAFAEFMLTLEYLAMIREDELTSKYQFTVDFEDLKWLASIALQQIAGGHGLSSPEVFYPSPPRPTIPKGSLQPDKSVNPPTMANTDASADLIKELSQIIFSQRETEVSPGNGTSRSYDDFVRPRSRDYGIRRPYFHHRVPPTTYSFRKPNDMERKRINKEFFDGQKCIACDTLVLPDYFDIWIGEPNEDNVMTQSKKEQRMSDVLANIGNIAANKGIDDVIVAIAQPQTIDSDKNITDREVLTYGYGVIPMDGRDGFIAFAKSNQTCPRCGTDPANSVSLMPKY